MKPSKVSVESLYACFTRWSMVLQDSKVRRTNLNPQLSTMEISAIKLEEQHPDVFQRQWTQIDQSNPIWRAYCAMLRSSKESAEKAKRTIAACCNCMTLFIPAFPEDDFHLHKLSTNFKTATNKKTIRFCDQKWLSNSESERRIEESFQYKALTALAREAGAYKKENGVEYIKLLRVVHGVRSQRGQTYFKLSEVCENADFEEPPAEVSAEKLKLQLLASDILKLINQ